MPSTLGEASFSFRSTAALTMYDPRTTVEVGSSAKRSCTTWRDASTACTPNPSTSPIPFGFCKLSTDRPGTLHLLYPPRGESRLGHTSAAHAVGRTGNGSRNLKGLHIDSQHEARSRRRNGSGGLGTAVALSREPAPSNGTDHLFLCLLSSLRERQHPRVRQENDKVSLTSDRGRSHVQREAASQSFYAQFLFAQVRLQKWTVIVVPKRAQEQTFNIVYRSTMRIPSTTTECKTRNKTLVIPSRGFTMLRS